MQNKIGVLFTASLITSVAVADNHYNFPSSLTGFQQEDIWAMEESQGPSKAELLKHLQRKKARAEERMSLIDQEIRCVESAEEGDGSIWRCYEIAQQKKLLFKQRTQSQSPYRKQYRNRGNGMMPNFDQMGMGRMPMPW